MSLLLLRNASAFPVSFAVPVVTLTTNIAVASITQGTATDIVVTMARENYVGLLTLAATGLPSGVTASWPDGNTAANGVTQRVLRLTAAADATVVAGAAWTVTATGEGGTPATGLSRTVSVISAASVSPLYETSFEEAPDGSTNELDDFLNTADFRWSTSPTAVRVTNNSETASLPPEYPGASDGVKAIRFNYNASSPGTDGNSELYWQLDVGVPAIWTEFKWYVPAIYAHRNDLPNNNKWFYVFGETYGSGVDRALVDIEIERAGPNSSNCQPKYSLATRSDGQEVDAPSSSGLSFIDAAGPVVPGQWNTMRVYVKMSSTYDTADGAIGVWANGTQVYLNTTLRLWPSFTPASTVAYFRRGVLMGYSNSGYAEQTRFFVDSWKVYTTNPGWS